MYYSGDNLEKEKTIIFYRHEGYISKKWYMKEMDVVGKPMYKNFKSN